MDIVKLPELFDDLSLWMLLLGVCIFAASFLPRQLSKSPMGMPLIIFVIGYLMVLLPTGLEAPDLQERGTIVEHITELGVIVTLMATGLRIVRPFSFRGWSITWRLLCITMILTVALTFLAGFWIAAFVPATAMLLGAVISPTDSLVAFDVDLAAPTKNTKDQEADRETTEEHLQDDIELEAEDEVRFAVSTESGFNDSLAFPFTNLAILMAFFGSNYGYFIETWLWVNVVYEIGIGFIVGIVISSICAKILFKIEVNSEFSKSIMGLSSLGFTLIIYGLTQYLGGYGFFAVFVGAITIRQMEPAHFYHKFLVRFVEKVQRVLMVIILLGLGAAVAGDILEPLNFELILVAVIIIFVIRPLAGFLGLLGFKKISWRDKLGVIFLIGIRGFGAIYYLSYALNTVPFPGSDEIYALVVLVIIISLFMHSILASPLVEKLDNKRKE